MNKVIFMWFLTVSICFSLPTEPQASDNKSGAHPAEANPIVPHTEAKPVPPADTKHPDAAIAPSAVTKTPDVHPKTPEPHPDHSENKTINADPKITTPVPPEGTTQSNETKLNETKSNNATIPENKTDKKNETSVVTPVPFTDAKNTTTDKNNNVVSTAVTPTHSTDKVTTVAPKTDDKHDVVLQSRGFDGPSFFGGIILTLGMLAIGFIGFKYYKSQTERNYHTL